MSSLKKYVLPRISDKKRQGKDNNIKKKLNYEYGHSTGYET